MRASHDWGGLAGLAKWPDGSQSNQQQNSWLECAVRMATEVHEGADWALFGRQRSREASCKLQTSRTSANHHGRVHPRLPQIRQQRQRPIGAPCGVIGKVISEPCMSVPRVKFEDNRLVADDANIKKAAERAVSVLGHSFRGRSIQDDQCQFWT